MRSETIASVISLLSSPTIVPAFVFLALLYPENTENSALLMAICLIFGTLGPLAILHQLSRRGMISDFFVSAKEQRAKPFVGTILSYLLGASVLLLMRAPSIVTALMLSYGGNTIVMMIVTFRWKISVHAAHIAGSTIALVYDFGPWPAVLLALLVPVGWARIRLRAHSPRQLLAGLLLAMAITWLQLKIYLAVL